MALLSSCRPVSGNWFASGNTQNSHAIAVSCFGYHFVCSNNGTSVLLKGNSALPKGGSDSNIILADGFIQFIPGAIFQGISTVKFIKTLTDVQIFVNDVLIEVV